MVRSRTLAILAILFCAVIFPSRTILAAPSPDLETITSLAAKAYVWGLGPEYIERFSKYNTIIGAPFNAFKYGSVPAAWNNEATNAGDASVLYISGFVNFELSPALVLTVPPSSDQYYVVAYYDAYGNTIGSIGTRTTPSDTTTSYLLVGPKSPYASKKTAKIHGHEYPVMASDSNVNWFLIRILANSLIDASDPRSAPNVYMNVSQKFALNTLQEFEQNGHQPVYPANFVLPPPTQEQKDKARPFQNAPRLAVEFFTQLGNAVVTNPIPNRGTGLSGTPLPELPPWMAPQYGATTIYLVPSYGQKETFDSFAPIGLTHKGFSIPKKWGSAERAALQAGYELGQKILAEFISNTAADKTTNFWAILNDLVGTYPNTEQGYFFRSLIVVEGGVANIAVDAVYPTDVALGDPVTGATTPFDGDHTYKVTFMPPASSYPPLDEPVDGIYPPMVPDSSGDPKGFWSIHVYARDPTQGAAPFIAQTSVQNTTFSTADTEVVAVQTGNFMKVKPPNWGTLIASTPILFDSNAAAYGLQAGIVYFVANISPLDTSDNTYTIQVTDKWLQPLSDAKPPVPIQGPEGNSGDIITLSPGGTGPLKYGMVKPVTQLGSTELASNLLTKNADGSLTLWFGPSPPPGAPATNWIPTPNTAYYSTVYDKKISTSFQLTLRMYYPMPGDKPPSILPCSQACAKPLAESYIPALVELVN